MALEQAPTVQPEQPAPGHGRNPAELAASRAYRPYGAIRDLFFYRGSEMFLVGPSGTGKSRGCMEKVHACMCKYPNSRALFLRKTRASLTDAALPIYEKEVLPEGSSLCKGASPEHRHSYRYPNGSEIVAAGLDDPLKVMSTSYDIVYIQELIELSEDDYEMVLTRNRARDGAGGGMPYQQVIGDLNPGAPTHWARKRALRGEFNLRPTTHKDNPLYYDHEKGEWTEKGRDYIENKLGKLTGHRRKRLLEGEWAAADGSRFPQLNHDVHRFRFYDRFPQGLPAGYNLLLGIDYGLRAPYCCLWIAVDYDTNIYVFREDYRRGLTADVQATEIVKLTKSNEQLRYVYADPSIWAEYPRYQPGPRPEKKCTAEYYREVFNKDPRFGPLLPGFNKSRRHALDTIDTLLNRGNGHPDLYIEESCQNLWDELVGAVWDSRGTTPETREDIDPSCPDHAITALYYAVHTYLDAPERDEADLATLAAEADKTRLQRLEEEALRIYEHGSQRHHRI